jgi:hypothetical protein
VLKELCLTIWHVVEKPLLKVQRYHQVLRKIQKTIQMMLGYNGPLNRIKQLHNFHEPQGWEPWLYGRLALMDNFFGDYQL